MAKKEKKKSSEEKEKNLQNDSADKKGRSSKKKTTLAKKILKITGFTFAGIFAVLLLLVIFRDPIIKFGVTSIGSWVTGVEITLDEVDTSLTKGSATIKGLRVANPQGYERPHMLELEEFHADIDLSSLSTKEIVIEDIRINNLNFTAEFNKNGSFNVTELTGNLKKRFPPKEEDEEEPEEEKKSDTALLFKNIDVKVKLTLVHDFSHATLSMPVSYSKQNLRIAPEEESPTFVERLDEVAKHFESFCQACFNAGKFVITAGAEAGEMLKEAFSSGVDEGKKVIDGGKKVLDNSLDRGKNLLDSATRIFK